MSCIVTAVVESLPSPAADQIAAALRAPATRAEHDRLAGDMPGLSQIEYRPAANRAASGLRVAAWNAERCKYHAASVALLGAIDADIVLLSEMDCGMARSGNRHTAADLAAALGMGYAYGVEFVELGLGDAREQRWHAGTSNRIGYHGNAILARLPLADLALVRLGEPGRWFGGRSNGGRAGEQRRLGGRMALAARIATGAGDIAVAALHLESDSDAPDRADQMARLLTVLAGRYGDLPTVIGGDCNTAALPPAEAPQGRAARCDVFEPLFGVMAATGYDWHDANDMAPTQRMRPDGLPKPPFRRIDWLFTRGLSASAPRTVAAVDAAGRAISDHELLAVDLSLD